MQLGKLSKKEHSDDAGQFVGKRVGRARVGMRQHPGGGVDMIAGRKAEADESQYDVGVMTTLEQQFEEMCLSDLSECKSLGYNPSYFLKMLEEYGAVEAVRRLILQEPIPEGFSRLWEMHRLDLTIEAGVHDNPQFHPLFDAQTLAACDARLASVGYI